MNSIYLREVTIEDMEQIYIWANDGEVRRNSFSIAKISMEEHEAWFRKVLMKDRIRQYVMVVENVPVGQIRITIDDNVAEIGYSISKEYRNKGYGKLIVKLLIDKITDEYPQIYKLVARVKEDNVLSSKIFQSLGFGKNESGYVLCINR